MKIIINVYGGMVQAVYGPDNVEVEVFDFDCYETEEQNDLGETTEEMLERMNKEIDRHQLEEVW